MTIDIARLKDSKQFLNLILENIDAAIFIVDGQLNIYQFNNSFSSLFNPEGAQDRGAAFGPIAGCINAVTENKPCGETSFCQFCVLRQALEKTASGQQLNQKQSLERVFYINEKPVKKYLEFTCRPIEYAGREMLLVFMYDVTPIQESKRLLKEKQQQINIDLEKASDIQRSLLPAKRPEIPQINVDWFFEPSHKVGGDVFHIYPETASRVSCYMLDVSGHGVSAALVAVMVKQFLDHLHIKGLRNGHPYEPRAVLRLLDQEFPFERFGSYLTIVSLLFDTGTGRLTYGCAGHVPPVIVGENRSIRILDQRGPIIGIGRNSSPQQYETVLSENDKLVIYTDGLVDYFGRKGAVSNTDTFYTTLQAAGTCSASKMVEQVVSQRNAKGGNSPLDDISLMVLEYLA